MAPDLLGGVVAIGDIARKCPREGAHPGYFGDEPIN
jgi:hypothetical protein